MRLLHPTSDGSSQDLTAEDLFDFYDEPGPYFRAGFVAALDGAIAVEGKSGALGGPADKAVFRALRTVCDAVVVGAGTLRAEDYGPVLLSDAAVAWREAHGRAAQVPIVVVTRSGDLGNGRVRQGPVLVTGEDLPADPAEMVAALHERGLTRLLCEGGPGLLTTLLAAGLIDELCLTTSPTLVGDGPRLVDGLDEPVAVELRSLLYADPGLLLGRWTVVPSAGD